MRTQLEERPNPIHTLRLVPLLYRVAPHRVAAILRHVGEPRRYAPNERIESKGRPGVAVRILAAGGIIRSARLPPPPDHCLRVQDLEDPALEFAPRRFGGAILPEHDGATAPTVLMAADNWLHVWELTHAQLDAIAATPAWRRRPQAWRALREAFQIAAMLGVSPIFSRLDQGAQHALARVLKLAHAEPGFTVEGNTWPGSGTVVFGSGVVARVRIELKAGAPIDLDFGLGDVFGVQSVAARLRSMPDVARFRLEVRRGGPIAVLPSFNLPRALTTAPGILQLARNFYEVFSRGMDVARALARSELFAGFAPEALIGLLFHARAVLWRVASHAPPAIEAAPSVLVVYEGELIVHLTEPDPHGGPAPASYETVGVAGARAHADPDDEAMQVLGVEAFVRDLPASRRVEPRLPSRVIVIPAFAIYGVWADGSPEAARLDANIARIKARLLRADGDRAVIRGGTTARPVDVALLAPLAPMWPELPLAELADRLAASIEGEFGERTAVVRLPAGGDVIGALRGALAGAADHVQALVIAEPGADVARVREAVDRVVYLNPGPAIRWPSDVALETPYVYGALIDDRGVEASGPTPFPPGAVRLFARYGGLSPEGYARLARAVTGRRVGVALGGGGSWGYAHVAVLIGLRDNGIPVDVVAGTSFGSVVGAYYCRDPERGLDQLLAQQLWIQFSNWGNYLSGVFFEKMLDAAFGGATLELLPCPFVPVTTDLVTGSMRPFLAGSLGRGVRVSGAYAPILPAVFTKAGKFVDGGMSANVPALAVQHEGARLVIASDAVPAPKRPRVYASFVDAWPVDMALDLLDLRRRMQAYMDGYQALVNTAGELSAAVAPIHFESNQAVSMAAVLVGADRIVNNALTDPDFWSALQLAKAHWAALKAPRTR